MRLSALLLSATFLSTAALSNLADAASFKITGTAGSKVTADIVADFDRPWAMTFIDNDTLIVTTKLGKMWLVTTDGNKTPVRNLPKVDVGGQGGLGDVVLHPGFASNQLVYFSYVEAGPNNTRGAVVARAKLTRKATVARLDQIETIWRQFPKTRGKGHYSHRIAFGPAGTDQAGKLFITSGDRQQKTPAQRWDMALGKIIRLNDDGSVPKDNPWQNQGKLAKTFWSTGHRNLLGIAFDASGKLWAHEMGPRHGDELNLIVPGSNYGWPVVSNGTNYSGIPIPSHNTRPEFNPPKAYWVPSIAPSGLIHYSGKDFPQWKGNAFIGGLVSQALIRVDIKGNSANEAERFKWRKRIREVEQAPDGSLWVLEDRSGGRLLKLQP